MIQLTGEGVLPPGVHDLTLDEVELLFGQFQSSDRRPSLFGKLKRLVNDAQAAGFVRSIIVDGSFVTAKPDPGDIDLIFGVDPEILGKVGSMSLTPAEYATLSSRRLRRAYEFDVLIAPDQGETYGRYVKQFAARKGNSAGEKGLVRLKL
jgi:hypothetical protein